MYKDNCMKLFSEEGVTFIDLAVGKIPLKKVFKLRGKWKDIQDFLPINKSMKKPLTVK